MGRRVRATDGPVGVAPPRGAGPSWASGVGDEPIWSRGDVGLVDGRLALPARECWAWLAEPLAMRYWRTWTTGATRHMRGWFSGAHVSTVAVGAGPRGSCVWSMSRWAVDDGHRPDADELAAFGWRVREGCRALGLDRVRGSPGSVAVALLGELCRGRFPRVPRELQAWCSGAVYGGRAEAWRVGELGPCVQWDRRSAYVAHLRDPLPDPRSARWTAAPSLAFDGVSDAIVDVPHGIAVPPLPVRVEVREGERTVYPVGRMAGRWTHAELRAAADRGCRVELGQGVEFHRLEAVGPYQRFADRVWSTRRTWPDAKRVGVSLVGRLHAGLVRRDVVALHADEHTDPSALAELLGAQAVVMGASSAFGRVGPDVAIMRRDAETWSPFVNLPAAVTILARARLELLAVMESNVSRLVACATDGVLLSGRARPSGLELVGDDLGAWRVEALARSGALAGPLHYRLDLDSGETKWRTAGIVRQLAEEFLRGRVARVSSVAGLAAGSRAYRETRRTLSPSSVSVTGGRRGGAPVQVDVVDGRTVVVG